MRAPRTGKGRCSIPESDDLIDLIREWVRKADADLVTAAHTLKLGKRCPTDTVCFHAQQCVEKYIKALLVLHGTDFPKTHDIDRLVQLLPEGTTLPMTPEERRELTVHATVFRYPGTIEEATLPEAKRWVRVSRVIRNHIRKMLPARSLRSGRS